MIDQALGEVVAGWPLAASLAALAVRGVQGGRRRTALNECLHELRRPLQALALAAPRAGDREGVESCLRLAGDALERLDREINGGDAPAATATVWVEPLVRSSLARWRPRAELGGSSLRLRWRAGRATVIGEAGRLEQAIDNLLLNAIEHGGATVAVEVRHQGRWLAISVVDTGPRRRRPGGAGRLAGRPAQHRHGHGLRVVGRVAAEHGGQFELRRSPGRTEARLLLLVHEAGAAAW
jgi:signal transduction histidine kinase